MDQSRRIFLLLYSLSGAAALVYEVAWTRLLALQLGHTVAAASTVLAAFMGGLAIGAWVAGSFDSRVSSTESDPARDKRWMRSPLGAYAALEIAVAATALVLPSLLHATVPLLAWAYADGTNPVRFGLIRVLISLVLLGIPAAAMGATFPIATAWAARSPGNSAADAGALYAANTCGAAAGAVAAGFWLIPALGLRGTTGIGVSLNLIAAGGAFWVARRAFANDSVPRWEPVKPGKTRPRRDKKAPRSPRAATAPPSPFPARTLAVFAVAISGFAALVYEVAWTRLLALVIGPTTYAFATMAASFIAGLAIGSAAGTRMVRRVSRPVIWLSAMLVASATAASLATSYAATRLPLAVGAEVANPGAVFDRVLAEQSASVFILLLPMTFALGATFPLALAAAGTSRSAGRDAAHVYTANTIGAITGALVAGFALIPWFGLRMTVQSAALLSALTGIACLHIALEGRRLVDRWLPAVAAAAALAAILLQPSWNRELLSSGAYKYAPYMAAGDLDAGLRAGTLEYYREGAAGTVSVRRLTGVRALAIDGKVDASNGGDMLTQRLLGLLPVALHGRAQDICVIGLGSGVTVGSALAPGTVKHADVIEISPEVVEASHLFDRENGAALSAPEVRLIVGDGRSHLLLTPRRYDVIVSEPSNPWMAGVATLFTREFFEAARARLTPTGLLCQWAHTYDISADDLQSIVRTFASVFPRGTMWLVGESDLLLIGGLEGMDVRLARLPGALKGRTADILESVGVSAHHAAFDLLSLYAGGPAELARYGDAAVVQTDDRTALEYSAPRGIYGKTRGDNSAAIRGLLREPPPAIRESLAGATDAAWTSRGTMQLKAEAYDLAYEAFQKAVTLNSRSAEALGGLIAAAAGAHKSEAAMELLKGIAAREPRNAAARVELAHLQAAAGDLTTAAETAAEAFRLAPDDPRGGEELASIVADAGDADRLQPLAASLAERFPGRPDPEYYLANALFLKGRTEEALAAARRVVERYPEHARAQNLLGAACATLRRPDCAKAAFEASLRANPRDASTYVNLGVFHLQSGATAVAAEYFSEALAIDPRSAAARDGLAQARGASNPD